MRIVVVDDSPAARAVVRRFSHDAGFEVVAEALHGRQGLELLGSGIEADLAVVDVYMPSMGGIQFVEALRSDARFEHLAILMASSDGDLGAVSEALTVGADEYLIKPYDRQTYAMKARLAVEHRLMLPIGR